MINTVYPLFKCDQKHSILLYKPCHYEFFSTMINPLIIVLFTKFIVSVPSSLITFEPKSYVVSIIGCMGGLFCIFTTSALTCLSRSIMPKMGFFVFGTSTLCTFYFFIFMFVLFFTPIKVSSTSTVLPK